MVKVSSKTKLMNNSLNDILAAIIINSLLLVDLFRMLFNIDTLTLIVQFVLYFGSALYIYYNLFFKKSFKGFNQIIIFILFVSVVLLLSYVITPAISFAFPYFIQLLLSRFIPAFILFLNINESNGIFFEKMKWFIFVWIFYAVVGLIYIPTHTNAWSQYSMTFSYNLLMPACILFYYNYTKFKIGYFLTFLLISLAIVWRGSRGALLCLLVFILFFTLLSKSTKKKTAFISIVLLLAVLFVINYDYFSSVLLNTFRNSRTLQMILNGSSNFDSGRGNIAQLYLGEIRNNPFAINGIFSDRVYYSYANGIKNLDTTNYPHNFFIEVFYQFGVIIGSVLLIALLVLTIKTLHKVIRNKDQKSLCIFLYLICSGIVRLFLSASYLTTIEFYIFVAFCINYLRRKNLYETMLYS